MRWFVGALILFSIVSLVPVEGQSPQYRRPAPAPEECPQGRQIRAQRPYPATMTDCEVLDADTSTENQKLQRPQGPPATRQLPKAPLALVAPSLQSPIMSYQQVAVSSCTTLLNAFGTPAFGDMGNAIVGFVNSRTGLGNAANIEDYVATECRLHEDVTVGQAVENLFEQQKQNRLPRIPIGGASDNPVVHANWDAFGRWVHHQGPPPDFKLVDASEQVSTSGFSDSLKNPLGQDKMSSGLAWTILLVVLLIYFMPALIAANRGHHNTLAIFALNLFLGWSFLGWVIALVWACTQTQRRDPIEHGDVLAARRDPRM
jgi:Superinfection immunity protein